MEEQYNDIKKLVREAGVEDLSVDFLQNVMNEVQNTSIDQSLVYQPLISRKAWMIISLIVTGVLVSLPFLSEGTWVLSKFDLSLFSLNDFKNPFSGFRFHTTTTYGIIFLAILFLVQITVIKRRIDKTYSV
ncbi:hypothetical protein SAMN04487910_3334 [Aquimarina amphilecti]|uniref:Uncharacterized protein n=1 Tax=Aquimarina amphilecti TaxID=1038014 RepID=A0A1H7T9E0_AQUAM|nr:hypothetical protein [Aquimarina amphilecti]SEL81353.1 hypothetical protein SAMN04487910_3334 [Aquimarina amphilecti]